MRILAGIALVTVLTAAVWSIDPTTAKQHNTVSIDPIGHNDNRDKPAHGTI